jgi:hypothetical protein
MVKITKRCFCCGKESSLEITEEVNKIYQQYLRGVGYIQDIPLDADKREFLKTGMCVPCQEMIFAEPDEDF